MAASRIASSARRFFRRYHMFFFVAFMLLTIQLYLGYSFYAIKQDELRQLEEEYLRKRSERLGEHSINSHIRKSVAQPIPDAVHVDLQQDVESVQDAILGAGNHGNHQNTQRDAAQNINKSYHELRDKPPHFILQGEPKNSPFKVEKPYSLQHNSSNINLVNRGDQLKAPPGRPDAIFGGNMPQFYSPKCSITEESDKEAYHAILRAETESCKQEISDVVCLHREGKMFPREINANTCPLRTNKKGQYLGCFRDDQKKRLLGTLVKSFPQDNSINKCINICLSSGFDLAGLEWGLECWCAEKINAPSHSALPLPEEECNTPCPGAPTKACGGYNSISIYVTGSGARSYFNPPLVDPSDIPSNVTKARVVFILTLNGRALRQVKRLIKALYHTDHYFLIHVDQRQEYLHRELTKATTLYSNIRMAPTRFATIWGGANLSKMLMECMNFLLSSLSEWRWDFLINLSESDYPVRPIQQLVAFLSVNKEKNFLKSHGKDTPRFIQKQGLEHTFVQCDHHMWRVGKRHLPLGIRVDGGSDWVALNREYCRYLVTSEDELLKAAKHYWAYTLLPGESFWHTVLQNTEYCTTFANNNLHIVNWNRRKGCKCQYKAIVDWCGCSPNDFLASDMPKFISMHEKKKIVFFARKFEAIVSQEIVNQLDAFLYGSYPSDTPGLSSYWENRYTIEDKTVVVPDSQMTFYETFARGSLSQLSKTSVSGHCELKLAQVREVHVYQQLDKFQGLLVRFRAENQFNKKTYTMEAYAQYQVMFNVYGNSAAVSRLRLIEVGTNFDPKEEFFRNHGDLMGPHSTPTVALFWHDGPTLQVTVAVIDPAQVVAVTFEAKVKDEDGEHALTFDLSLETPLRPGIWTVKLLYAWNVIAVSHFLVTPYFYYGGRPISNSEATQLHNGPLSGKYQRDITNYKDISELLELDNPSFARDVATKNSRRTGDSLLEWIDDLTFKFWRIRDLCITSSYSPCSSPPVCDKTSWSSLAPDPKSEFGLVNTTTGRMR